MPLQYDVADDGPGLPDDVRARLTAFIRAANETLAFAIYDMRFSDPLRAQLTAALRDRVEAGVKIRFCYDGDKPPEPNLAAGQDYHNLIERPPASGTDPIAGIRYYNQADYRVSINSSNTVTITDYSGNSPTGSECLFSESTRSSTVNAQFHPIRRFV